MGLNQSSAKQIYVRFYPALLGFSAADDVRQVHTTCATDTSQIKFVLSAVNDIVIQGASFSCPSSLPH